MLKMGEVHDVDYTSMMLKKDIFLAHSMSSKGNYYNTLGYSTQPSGREVTERNVDSPNLGLSPRLSPHSVTCLAGHISCLSLNVLICKMQAVTPIF